MEIQDVLVLAVPFILAISEMHFGCLIRTPIARIIFAGCFTPGFITVVLVVVGTIILRGGGEAAVANVTIDCVTS